MSNSVLRIESDTVYISPRTATAAVQYTFYGQASLDGPENILDLDNFRTGINRVFNYWVWKDTNTIVQDSSSVSLYGIIRKEIESDAYTDNTKRTNILTSLKDEFRNKKIEITLTTFIDPDKLALDLLDKVTIDFPQDWSPATDLLGVRYGLSPDTEPDYDGADGENYAETDFTFGISTTTEWKIMAREIDFIKETIKFTLREV